MCVGGWGFPQLGCLRESHLLGLWQEGIARDFKKAYRLGVLAELLQGGFVMWWEWVADEGSCLST